MNWQRIFKVIFFILFMAMFLMSIRQRPTYSRKPIIYSILVLGISANLICEYYRNKNAEKYSLQIKNNLVKKLTKNYQPLIEAENIPEELMPYIKVINLWGTDNKILREYLYEKSDKRDLIPLKKFVDNNLDLINRHINTNENQKITKALKHTLIAYNELGLWTWEEREA